MSPEEAAKALTPEAIRTTTLTLMALDCLQGDAYLNRFEAQIRKEKPHSESEAFDQSSKALRSFSLYAPMGSSNGVDMFVSAFINGLQILEMREEMENVRTTCIQFRNEHPDD